MTWQHLLCTGRHIPVVLCTYIYLCIVLHVVYTIHRARTTLWQLLLVGRMTLSSSTLEKKESWLVLVYRMICVWEFITYGLLLVHANVRARASRGPCHTIATVARAVTGIIRTCELLVVLLVVVTCESCGCFFSLLVGSLSCSSQPAKTACTR